MSWPRKGPTDDLQRLIALLRGQREAPIAIDPTVLRTLTAQITALCDRIERSAVVPDPAARALLAEARLLAEQGQRDIRALIQGVSTVIERLRQARAPQPHGVYGPTGKRVVISRDTALLDGRR